MQYEEAVAFQRCMEDEYEVRGSGNKHGWNEKQPCRCTGKCHMTMEKFWTPRIGKRLVLPKCKKISKTFPGIIKENCCSCIGKCHMNMKGKGSQFRIVSRAKDYYERNEQQHAAAMNS